MASLRDLFLATGPWSFPMTLMSITIGSVYAYLEQGVFDLYLYILVALGSVLLHAFTNIFNDYFDYRYSVDRVGAPTTQYRPHPIVHNILSPKGTLLYSIVLFTTGASIGFYLVYLRGLMVLWIGLTGVLLAAFYTAPPFRFKYYALGEIGIFFAFGPIMAMGAYYVQALKLTLNSFLVAVPIGILIALVAFANNIRDIDYDTSAGIKTLASVLGEKRGTSFYFTMSILALLTVPLMALFDIIPLHTLISLLTILNVRKVYQIYRSGVPENADPLAAQNVIMFGILFIIGLIAGAIYPIAFP